MARVLGDDRGRSILAETAPEALLLEHAARRGQLVLLDAYFAVQGRRVLLPEGIAAAAAARICRALEVAAETHALAVRRRRSFRVVQD